ncbi:MAG: GTP-binding protein [Myxococcales bacterium FL481]|nr:MAG: GTP-binding protein [Myxococcales bacterium FL481]
MADVNRGGATRRAGPTLVGVATGTVDGGVAIVRVSGAGTRELVEGVLEGELAEPRRLVRRRLRLLSGFEDALVVWMPGPRSFTGEDVVELHIHAGPANVEEVVEELLARGATAAGPGDFSRRAFERGRMSLDQAEGFAALIGAQSAAQAAMARRLCGGELGRAVDGLVARVREALLYVTAVIDFPEDVAESSARGQASAVADVAAELERWLAGFEAGRRQRMVPRVVLAGPPNAGKSALFNMLLGHGRAIVASQPGTTRDYLEQPLTIDGFRCLLVDTAGLRGRVGAVEQAGIERSREQMAGADVIIWVEAADEPDADDAPPPGAAVLRVENKRDQGRRREWLGACATTGAGRQDIEGWLRQWFRGPGGDAPWVGLARHRDCAERSLSALKRARRQLEPDGELECAAVDLEEAVRHLDAIRGRGGGGAVGEAVLREVFGRLCIGK